MDICWTPFLLIFFNLFVIVGDRHVEDLDIFQARIYWLSGEIT